MADIRCPNCGRSNPDLLDVCQFCQTPLKPDSVLRSGENPTKKNTGELESILPDWLKDMRQQSKDAAEADAAQAESTSNAQASQPPDLLAGLATQSGGSDDEDVPDWLASINPSAKIKSSAASEPKPSTDFFAQFNQSESKAEPKQEPPEEEAVLPWMSGTQDQTPVPAEKDELSAWLTQASQQPDEITESDEDQSNMGWGRSLNDALDEKPAPKEEEDLSWLHNLEAESRQTGGLQPPRQEQAWAPDFETPSTVSPSPDSPQEDLSWLDRLGGIEEPSQPDQAPAATQQDDLGWLNQLGGLPETPQTSQSQPAAPQPESQQDLSWLNDLGRPSDPQPGDAVPDQPSSSSPFKTEEDLDWLNKLGGIQEPEQASPAFNVPDEKPSSEEDLSWLNDLGKPSAPSTASEPASQEDLSWLNQLGGDVEPSSTPPFAETDKERVSPRQTAPLNRDAVEEAQPDWLKSATEARSMPASGELSMDWFSSADQTDSEKTPPSTPAVEPFKTDIFETSGEPAPLSNQEVDSLFSVDLPDWLSRPEAEPEQPVSQQPMDALPAQADELTPVDLPSWVQAMRPVEAVITETASSVSDQPAETEGPLAGLHGVIPIAPIGSSRRPRAVSLTLQVSEEQQASALLLEQILGSETSPRALVTSPVVTSQEWLRWGLTALFFLVLGAVIFLRSQIMPVSASLPLEAAGLSNAVIGIPANARVLVVVDYEPSLAGEMEAIAGPLLDQIVLLSQPNVSFVSTSPNGAALVGRLLANTKIEPVQYSNLGYLPGGSAGVLGFLEAPGQIMPAAGATSFSDYSVVVVLTDHAESGRVWVEQLQNRKQVDLALSNQPLLVAASAQAGPLLKPYVSSGQITGMISGLSDASRYEFVNNSRPGIARSYWDTFGVGLMMSIAVIVIGSLWSLFAGMRARRAGAEQG